MNKEIEKLLKQSHGTVLGIGLNQRQVEILEQNDQVLECTLLNSYAHPSEQNGKKEKTIRIKKLRHYFKKKKVDYIVCKYEEISKYFDSFVKNSVYINKETLCFFGKLDEELIQKRYGRYQTKIIFKKYEKESIAIIDNSHSKNNKVKEFFYSIIDIVSNVITFIGDILMN